MAGGKARARFRLVHLLLFVPFIALLWVPFYDRADPALAGVPFYYWYQMLWIVLGAFLLWPIFRAEERDNKNNGA